jgi:hypothetical protein
MRNALKITLFTAATWVITATGTIYSDGPYGTPDQTGLFGARR